jgi:hypothetical protein
VWPLLSRQSALDTDTRGVLFSYFPALEPEAKPDGFTVTMQLSGDLANAFAFYEVHIPD